ncbi:hypothetical protein A0H81_05072 [Grifola frondosa]|uniref:Uncharacterized protein n=1 Tax=Grifola frondosa TaxID=5627 RepID=A0A1C7MCJ7_GRIFR|nr:hypothetical protein A0H81_05072 [Grifola frondosa]
MSLPPGPKYLLHQFPSILAPPALVYVISYAICKYRNIILPVWLVVVAAFLSLPVAFALQVQWYDFKNHMDARAHDAVMAPPIEHKYPGSFDVLSAVFRTSEKGYLADLFFRWTLKYGHTFNFRVLFQNRMYTSEPEYIKTMLATDFPLYEKGPLVNEQLHTLLGTGVFNSDGKWKFHRSITRPFFSKDRISHFDIFDRHCDEALKKMDARLREGYAVDWQDLVSRFTMDSATEFLFGKDHPADEFVQAFQSALEETAIRGRYLQAWPLAEFWGDKVKRSMKAIDDFIDPIVADALRKKAQGETDTGDSGEKDIADDETLLEYLIKQTDDKTILKDETLNILLAGRDTTACTLTFAVYKLAERPDILRHLRKEVLATVGGARRPTYDDIRNMKYLRAFINETLRMYPPVPFDTRCSIGPTIWKAKDPSEKDFYIPARTRCLYSVFVMHRRTDLWGPDALKFDPDRFLDERMQKYLVRNPFIFLPFNGGPRICLGQQFAYNEASRPPRRAAAAGLLGLPGCEGGEKVWLRAHLTMYVKNGLWVKMGAVSEDETA